MNQFREGQTATNPQTGQRIMYRGGQWIEMTPQVNRQMESGFMAPYTGNEIERRSEIGRLAASRPPVARALQQGRLLTQFQELNRGSNTGGFRGIPLIGDVARDVEAAFNPAIKQMEGIRSVLQGQSRPEGSGATSDFEQRLYAMGVPGPDKAGPVNDNIINHMKAVTQEEADRLAFMERFIAANGTSAGSAEAWQSYLQQSPYANTSGEGNIRLNTQRQPWQQFFGLQAPRPAPRQPTSRAQARPAPAPRRQSNDGWGEVRQVR